MYNLRNQQIDFDYHPQYITEDTHNGKLQRSRTEVGDLIMNIVGPPLGKLALIPPTLPQANFNQAAVLIRPYMYKEILALYLKSYLEEMSEIDSVTTRGSAGQVNISLTQSQNMRIPLPPLVEQHRIVAEIERWFSLISIIESGKNDLRNTIKQAKNKILDLAIHGKLVPQDPNDEPAIELLKRINPDFTSCDNGHSGKLPQGWCYCNYKDVFSDVPSKAYQILQSDIQNDGKYPVISQSVNYIEGYTNTNNVFQHKIPCIIFGDHTRNVKYVDFDFVVGADGVKILCPKVNVKWSFYMIMYASSHIENKGYSRHFGQIVKFSYKLPPIAEQQRIVQKIGELFSVLDNIQKALEV